MFLLSAFAPLHALKGRGKSFHCTREKQFRSNVFVRVDGAMELREILCAERREESLGTLIVSTLAARIVTISQNSLPQGHLCGSTMALNGTQTDWKNVRLVSTQLPIDNDYFGFVI